MPLVRTEIELADVVQIMHSRGYGDHFDGRYALSFNRKDPDPLARWKMTGEPKRKPCGGGVSKAQLKHLLSHSENPVEAADRVEAIILGKEMLPMERQDVAGPVIDTSVMEQMVVNRIDSQIGRHMNPIVEVLGKLTDRLEQLEQKLTPPEPPKKKGGRPKGSKNKAKADSEVPTIDFGPRVKSDVKS